jgi:hypothetical protein
VGYQCGIDSKPWVCSDPLAVADAAAVCVPRTCATLGATCGPQGNGCGNLLDCGACVAPQTCGGGGTRNACGGDNGCVSKTCKDIGAGCGPHGDGCGGEIQCGSCRLPDTCGGGGVPSQCGVPDGGVSEAGLWTCDGGTCSELPNCGAGTTSLAGRVYDPAGNLGLYSAAVYIPNDPRDPGLEPFPPGVVCNICGAGAVAGDPITATTTAADGTFTLTGVPVGPSIPLVIQIGKWRRQFTVNVSTPCGQNTVPDGTLLMPRDHTQGDLPRIAIITGAVDPVECALRKFGIDDSEFGNPGSSSYVHLFQGTGAPGATVSGATPTQDALFAPGGGPDGGPLIGNYDMVIIECEGAPYAEPADEQSALAAYTAAGGRLFAAHYQYTWFAQNPAYENAAVWTSGYAGISATDAVIDQAPENPIAGAFESWLELAGVATPGSHVIQIDPMDSNTSGVVAPTEEWIHYVDGPDASTPIHFTFNTPVGAQAANQCGRVTYSDWHVELLGSAGMTFPTECSDPTRTAQDAILEFMFFDMASCVRTTSPACTATECDALGVGCGPAGDGCGGLLDCGECAAPESCGGGGQPGVCGGDDGCAPATCDSLAMNCGPAGDGCGGELRCGACTPPETCGGGGQPGVCSVPTASPCVPLTCDKMGVGCGPAGDGCGGALQCGTCTAPETCGGGGTPGQCGSPPCAPVTCASLGVSCGPAGDGCGGVMQCGTCDPPETCGGGGTRGKCGAQLGPH